MPLRAPPPRITMPPTPMRAHFLPASGFGRRHAAEDELRREAAVGPARELGRGRRAGRGGRRRRCGDGRRGGDAPAGRLRGGGCLSGAAGDSAAPRGPRRRQDECPDEGTMSHDSATVPSHARFRDGRGYDVTVTARSHVVQTRPQAATGPSEEPAARRSDRPDLGRPRRPGAALARAEVRRRASQKARSTTRWWAAARRSSRTSRSPAPGTTAPNATTPASTPSSSRASAATGGARPS